MKWYKHCSFCDLQPKFNPQSTEHQPHCAFAKTLRAASWSPNGIYVALDARRANEHG